MSNVKTKKKMKMMMMKKMMMKKMMMMKKKKKKKKKQKKKKKKKKTYSRSDLHDDTFHFLQQIRNSSTGAKYSSYRSATRMKSE
jgi:hypothetical protein